MELRLDLTRARASRILLNVLTLVRRLAAMAMTLTLCIGNLTVCAGWQATPEARMACCVSGTSCPMHKSEPHGSSSKHALSQGQADNCCAATSNRTTSSASSIYVVANAAAVPSTAQLLVPVEPAALQEWRAAVPLRVSPVPKYLLLSVLLV